MKKVELSPKELKHQEVKKRVEELQEKKKFKYMGDFMNYWNKNNKEKIQECVKIERQIIFHFNGFSINIASDMRLGFD